MDNFLLIIITIFIGYCLQKLKIFPEQSPFVLNQFIINVSLPAMIILQVPKLSFNFDTLIPTVVAWIVMIVSALIVLLFAKVFKWNKEVTGSLMLVSILTNSSIMGVPIINAYMGKEALPYVMIYDQLGSFIAFATYGTLITAYYSVKGKFCPKVILSKVITFPPFYCFDHLYMFFRRSVSSIYHKYNYSTSKYISTYCSYCSWTSTSI